MINAKPTVTVVAMLVVFAVFGHSTALASGIDFVVGLDTGEENQLELLRPANVTEPYELPFIVSGQFAGYFASIEPGWDGLGTESADFATAPLPEDAKVSLERIAFDEGFRMFDEAGNPLLDTDGAIHTFSGTPETQEMAWHEHLVFAFDGDMPGATEVTATFRLVDTSGVQTASEPFTLTFRSGSVPANCGDLGGTCGAGATAALLFTGLGLLSLRRR